MEKKIILTCRMLIGKHSTVTTMIKVVAILINRVERRVTALILIDFNKVFDLVSHNLLCAKLNYLNLSLKSRQLVASYLMGCYHYVSVDNRCSLGVSSGAFVALCLIYH